MTNEEIKNLLLKIENPDLDFSIVMSGKQSSRVNGLYKVESREIILHNKNFKTNNQLIYTAIHEYTHHLINADCIRENGGRIMPKGSRVHTKDFWVRFHELLEKAEKLGVYVIGLENSPELQELTETLRKEFIEKNGKLMQEFGKLLIKAQSLCEAAAIRFEDYIDRVLCLPRNSVRDAKRVWSAEMDPALGFENMKKLCSIKNDDERKNAASQILNGKSADSVISHLKKSDDIAPREKLEREKSRLEKTIRALQERLSVVEETLETLE